MVTAASARRHGLAHKVLPQHGTERGAAVAATRKRCGSRAFQLQIIALAVASDELAQQMGAAIAELRHEVPELVPRIGHRQRLRSGGDPVAGQHCHPRSTSQRLRVESKCARQLHIELNQLGVCHGSWTRVAVETLR